MMVDCIIQARMGSSRLPGKVLMKVDSKNTILDFMINQLKYSKLIDRTIIATSKKMEDDVIEDFCKKNSLNYFRGSEKDVLDRYYQCAKKFESKIIVRMPADKPLLDPTVVDKVVDEFNKNNYDYITTFLPSTFPSGTEVEIFSFSALEKAWNESNLPSEREHVTPYIYRHAERFRIKNLRALDRSLAPLNLAVDTYADLCRTRWVAEHLDDPIASSFEDIVKLTKEWHSVMEHKVISVT